MLEPTPSDPKNCAYVLLVTTRDGGRDFHWKSWDKQKNMELQDNSVTTHLKKLRNFPLGEVCLGVFCRHFYSLDINAQFSLVFKRKSNSNNNENPFIFRDINTEHVDSSKAHSSLRKQTWPKNWKCAQFDHSFLVKSTLFHSIKTLELQFTNKIKDIYCHVSLLTIFFTCVFYFFPDNNCNAAFGAAGCWRDDRRHLTVWGFHRCEVEKDLTTKSLF